jgi:predicted metalloprotease
MMVGGFLGTLILVVLALLLGQNPMRLLQQVQQQAPAQPREGPLSPEEEEAGQFVGVVLADTEDVWTEQFERMGREYKKPILQMFSGRTETACGFASAAVGPFYCPLDQKVYIDTAFFDELNRRFGAPGDFARAYVIAHEVGHHVQNLLGITEKVQSARGRMSEEEYNQLSVRLELQADFLAGVFARNAHESKNILEQGDIEEGLRCAAAIGDDRLQAQAQGYVVPDSFTHGTSEQRIRWFRRGLETGDMRYGDTFGVPDREL